MNAPGILDKESHELSSGKRYNAPCTINLERNGSVRKCDVLSSWGGDRDDW